MLADRTPLGQRRVAADVELRPTLVGLGAPGLRLVLHDLRQRLLDLCLTGADLGLGLAQLRFRLQELGLRLVEGCLKRPRIDLEQEVAGLHQRALPVILAHEVPADPGADLRIDVADQRPYILDGDRHVLFGHGSDLDQGELGCRCRARFLVATGERGGEDDGQHGYRKFFGLHRLHRSEAARICRRVCRVNRASASEVTAALAFR